MKIFILLSFIALTRAVEIHVSTTSELRNALSRVNPGDSIIMADGVYEGPVRIARSGTSSNPITLYGSKQAYIKSSGYGIHLQANFWILKRFTVKECKKGVVLDSANFNVMDNLAVHHINEEAIHLRYASSDNTIQNCIIKNTGLRSPGIGEGVYIGSSLSHWVNNKPDLSNRNKILKNRFGPYISAEAIDIKEGSESNLVEGNTFDGIGMSGANYADSWVDVKGAKNIIRNNVGSYSLLDGFQIHKVSGSVSNSACNNEFRDNICSKLNSKGVCVNLYSNSCSNTNINNIKP